MGALAEVKHEWKHFWHDRPGERFRNHRVRMRYRPLHQSMLAVGVGIVLVIIGIAMLFFPGPGSLFILFGLALVGTHSIKIARLLDRGEIAMRRLGQHLEQHWRVLPGRGKLGVLLGVGAGATAAVLAWWQFLL